MGTIEKVAAAEFLGMEFATWLYWQSETNNGKLKLEGLEEFEVWFEAPIQLTADYGEATQLTLKGGTPLEGPEARTAFREGKKIAKVKARVNYRGQTYTFGFNALNFQLSGLKIPTPPNANGPDYLFVRLEMFEEFEKFWSQVFDLFLAKRLKDAAWGTERGKIKSWVKSFDAA